MILGLSRSAGVIDWMIAWMRSISRSSKFASWSRNWPMPGQHPQDLRHRAHLADLLHLLEEVVEGELAALAGQLGGGLGRLLGVEGLLGLLDQGEHVAHAEDARGHPVGVEDVEVGELLAVGGEHDRLAGDRRDRQRGTTAGVAVELGEHDAVEADAVEEGLRGVDRVLADHRVDDEQDLVGLDRVADVAACCISSASMPSRPAVSTMTTSWSVRCGLARSPSRATVDRVADAVARLRGEDRGRRRARRRPAAG